ncbi:DUF2637 domain-containing protein [Streptomyces sp. NPDC047821]|uniref:DUF2637 domain-containing protein n=1 Tax=unclassified Streptomyces TaxID=2593676 RepID=UPI003631ACC9
MYESHGRHVRPPADIPPAEPLFPSWDPAEELASMLQGAIPHQHGGIPLLMEAPDIHAATGGGPMAGLEQITAELPPVRPPMASHRRTAANKRVLSLLQTCSVLTAAIAAAIVSMVSLYGGMVTYDPLRHIAEPRTSDAVVQWWPLLVYGPWMVASLSILRAALHRRRAAHSWFVVLLFSTIAMLLCVSQAPRTLSDAAAAALPSIAALACFQQLVRQITLTRPPRQAAPRHRNAPAPPPHKPQPAEEPVPVAPAPE